VLDTGRILELIRELDFVRVAGSAGEEEGFDVVARRLQKFGLQPRFESFSAPWIEFTAASLDVEGRSLPLEPLVSPAYASEWMCLPETVNVCGILASEEGLDPDRPRVILREGCDRERANLPRAAAQVLACEREDGFVAHLLATDRPCPSAYVEPQLAPLLRGFLGRPCRFQWTSRRCEKTFHNMVLEIEGRDGGDDVVVAGAHMDTWPGTVGASDDASGCAMLLEFARYFAANAPRCGAQLIWFTGEELDRRGSRAYVLTHRDDLPRIRLFVNLDSGVSVGHGEPTAGVAGPPGLAESVRHLLGGLGDDMPVAEERGSSSDATAFREAGVSSLHIGARYLTPPPHPHLPTDRPDRIDPAKVERIGRVSLLIADAALNGSLPLGPWWIPGGGRDSANSFQASG
jgi:hypothetical protein